MEEKTSYPLPITYYFYPKYMEFTNHFFAHPIRAYLSSGFGVRGSELGFVRLLLFLGKSCIVNFDIPSIQCDANGLLKSRQSAEIVNHCI